VKTKQALAVALIVVAIASGVAALGYVTWNMMSHTGVHAIDQMNAEERESLRRIASKLEELKIPYAVAGGMALVAHGYERTTVDVDVLVSAEVGAGGWF